MFSTSRSQSQHRWWLGCGLLLFAPNLGCSLWRPDKESLPEYLAARKAIDSYQDADGNWVRPEGLRAEKRRDSKLSAYTSWIPGLGEKPVNKELANSTYDEAMALFEQGKNAEGDERRSLFRRAAKKFDESAEHWRSSYHENNAMMMHAESLFFAEDYPKAEQAYARVIKEYPRTMYLDTIDARRMEIAVYWIRLDQQGHTPFYVPNLTDKRRPINDTIGHGKRTLENIRVSNPTGKVTDDATMELANEAFQRGDFETAADHFSDLRMSYPDSPHQFNAHFLGLRAVMETYQGADYNDAPLNEAEKLVKTLVRQFPQQAQQEKEYLDKAYREIRYRKAERLWNTATYRLNLQQNNAARVHLDRLLVEYEDTPFADKAREAAERIKDLPGDPKQPFVWLANLFPDRDPIKPFLQSSSPK